MLVDGGKKSILLHGSFGAGVFDVLEKKGNGRVVVTEGRPRLEASRKNSRQLLKRGIEPVLISDNMAGFLFFKGLVKEVWMAAQEEGEEGAVCEIGALILAVLAKEHGVPVRIFAASGRVPFLAKEKEIFSFMDKRIAPKGIRGYVPLLEFVPKTFIKES